MYNVIDWLGLFKSLMTFYNDEQKKHKRLKNNFLV